MKWTGIELVRDREGTNIMAVSSLAKSAYYLAISTWEKLFIIVE